VLTENVSTLCSNVSTPGSWVQTLPGFINSFGKEIRRTPRAAQFNCLGGELRFRSGLELRFRFTRLETQRTLRFIFMRPTVV